MSTNQTNFKSAAKHIASACLALTLALAFWETIDRLYISYHPEYNILPNKTEVVADRCVNSEEGYAICTFSKDGYRLPVPPPDASPRILVLGDSYCEAKQVSDNQTFASQLQAELRPQFANVGVWNAGMSGAAPSRYIGMASYYRQVFKPAVTVVQINAGDFTTDMANKSGTFWLEPTKDGWEIHKRDTTEKRGSLKQLDRIPALKGIASQAMRASLFQQVIFKVGQEFGVIKKSSGQPKKENDLDDLYRKHAKWIVRELAKAYPSLVIVYLPTVDYYKEIDPPAAMESALKEECEIEGVPFANMRTAFVDEYKRTGMACNGFLNTAPGVGHLNALGHRKTAEQLAPLVAEALSDADRKPKEGKVR